MAQYGNALVKKAKTTSEQPCTFTANGVEVKLTPATVKNYLVSGNAERITDQEVVMFINLCKYNGLNPWLREAYCIKYGSSPATMVVGKETFQSGPMPTRTITANRPVSLLRPQTAKSSGAKAALCWKMNSCWAAGPRSTAKTAFTPVLPRSA